jgi:hypothetical protein
MRDHGNPRRYHKLPMTVWIFSELFFMNMVRGQTYILRGRHDGSGEEGNDGESHVQVVMIWFELAEGEEVV